MLMEKQQQEMTTYAQSGVFSVTSLPPWHPQWRKHFFNTLCTHFRPEQQLILSVEQTERRPSNANNI